MREILFRGKRIDSGEWAYGDLHHNDDTRFPMTLIGHVVMSRDKYIQQDLNFDGYDLCEVDPETAGQFTGLTDKNGKKIFEGDILLIHDTKDFPVYVAFDNFRWTCLSKKFRMYRHPLEENPKKYEVIGNVHDDPGPQLPWEDDCDAPF